MSSLGPYVHMHKSVTKNAGNNARDKTGDTSAIIIKSVKLLQSVGVQGFQGGPETRIVRGLDLKYIIPHGQAT